MQLQLQKEKDSLEQLSVMDMQSDLRVTVLVTTAVLVQWQQ